MTTSLVLWCSLLTTPAMSNEPPAPARVPGGDVPAVEAPSLPRLAEPGGAEALAELLEVEWASFEQVRALDFPVLSAHWVRIGNAFFGYSTMMAQGEPVIEEWSIVAPRMLSLATLVNRSGLALVDALPDNDPTREARLAGLVQIRTSMHRFAQGSLLVLVEMPPEIRTRYVNDLGMTLPTVIALLPVDDAVALQAQVRGAGMGLPEDEARILESAAGAMGQDLMKPPAATGAPDRLLVAQTAAGWPAEMSPDWAEMVLDVNWTAHATDRQALRADAWALLVAGHAWQRALAEQRTDGLDTPARLLDAALRASTEMMGKDAALPDPAHFRRLVHFLVHRATAAAAHHSPRDREPMVASLARRLPPLFEAMPSEEAEALKADLRAVADRKLIRALDL